MGTGCKNLVAVVIDLDIIVRNKWVLVSVLGAETKQNFAYARPGGSVDSGQSKNGLKNCLSVGWTCANVVQHKLETRCLLFDIARPQLWIVPRDCFVQCHSLPYVISVETGHQS